MDENCWILHFPNDVQNWDDQSFSVHNGIDTQRVTNEQLEAIPENMYYYGNEHVVCKENGQIICIKYPEQDLHKLKEVFPKGEITRSEHARGELAGALNAMIVISKQGLRK